MRWTERMIELKRAMEDIEDPRGAELRDYRARLQHLETQQAPQITKPESGEE